MKVYIAGPWADRGHMPEIGKAFEQVDCTITHKWWETEDIPESDKNEETHKHHATLDYLGVKSADILILVNSAKSEGKAVEQGLAIADDKPIVAIGKRGEVSKNVFHYLENYFWVDSVEEAVKSIKLINWLVRNGARRSN